TIVRSLGGAIAVESEPGCGTTVRLLLPASAQQAELDAGPPRESGDSWRGHGLVLVADDVESVRHVTAAMLERLGFDVVVAADGREVLEVVEQRREELRLVVLDLLMPRLDGIEVLDALAFVDPSIPVVVSSGCDPRSLGARIPEGSVAAFLQKPFG